MTNKKIHTIKDWNEEDRPREKLLKRGEAALTDAELVAILLGSGNREETAVGLARRILRDVDNSLSALARKSIAEFQQYNGIGTAKAVTLMAALELGRRRRLAQANQKTKIRSSKDVFDRMQPILSDLPHEEFWVLYLNNANVVLHSEKHTQGGLTGTLVDSRMVLKQALLLGAVALILVHNHPSGTLVASQSDKVLTKKMQNAARTLDIKVLDHLIITEKAYFSFADENML
ncbi:MAG TPA: DNA repair protein RadC [Flavobacteriaceae bacterium]|nr:DNA repair protein RadC [Flavobacteriaceae bacterium]